MLNVSAIPGPETEIIVPGDSGFCKENIMQYSESNRIEFVVTSLSSEKYDAQTVYEDLNCAHDDMENRIKEQQLMLFATRTSTAKIHSNQMLLFFSPIAYVLLFALCRFDFHGTEMAKAQCIAIYAVGSTGPDDELFEVTEIVFRQNNAGTTSDTRDITCDSMNDPEPMLMD